MRNCKTQEVKLYMSNDIYFEHYPNSSVLKVHLMDTNVALQHLATVERMGCDGEKIIRHLK